MRWITILSGALALVLVSLQTPPVLGHARLLAPTPVSNSAGLKLPAPCGAPGAATLTGAPPTELVIGEDVLIQCLYEILLWQIVVDTIVITTLWSHSS